MSEIHKSDVQDNNNNNTAEGFDPDRRIEPKTSVENSGQYNPDKRIETKDRLDIIVNSYFEDLRNKSDYPKTIQDKPFDISDLKKLSPEENAKMREVFDDKKAELKREWEKKHGMPWPKYEHDVYSSNGNLIRRAGSDYDAHHIQPLGMGGKNDAGNITPLHAQVHYDKQGVHSPDSPYSKMNNLLGGLDE